MSNPNPQLPATCPKCGGEGYTRLKPSHGRKQCSACHGTGKVAEKIPTPDLVGIGGEIDTKAAETYTNPAKPIHETAKSILAAAPLDKHIDNLMADYGDALKELTDDGIDQLVRDACSVVPVSKSEYRKRLEAWSRMEGQRAVEAELQQLASLTPCAAHEGEPHGCATWIHDNIVQRISELKENRNAK